MSSHEQDLRDRKPDQDHFRSVAPSTSTESLGAGAAGGAAVGAVIALTIATSSSVIIPVIGALAGAVGGAALGRAANNYVTRWSATERRDVENR
jgi:outer membrane lipoprotein SlyB